MAEIDESKYECTQNQLYVLGGVYAANLTANLAAFTAHSPRFITAFITALTDAVTYAEGLPNDEQVKVPKMVDRVGLIPTGKFSISDLNALKTYLLKAFPTTFAIMYNSAGANLRRDAGNNNWVQIKALFKAMVDFMAVPANLAQLLLNDVMPAGFPAAVAAHQLTFNNDYTTFLSDKSTSEQTSAKITANNVIKAILTDIDVNGVVIFPPGNTKHDLFVFSIQKDIIAPKGSASLKVGVKLDGAFTVLPDIPVKIQAAGQPSITVNTDEEGIAHFPGIDPTKYKVTIIYPELVTVEFNKDVDTGVNARSEVLMETAPPPLDEEDPEDDESPIKEEEKKEEKKP
jgi:hypothetical protein